MDTAITKWGMLLVVHSQTSTLQQMKLRLNQIGIIGPGNQRSLCPTWIDFDVIMSEIVYLIDMNGIHLQKKNAQCNHTHSWVSNRIYYKRGKT